MIRNTSKQTDLLVLLVPQLHRILETLLQTRHELAEHAQHHLVVFALRHVLDHLAQLLVLLQPLERLAYASHTQPSLTVGCQQDQNLPKFGQNPVAEVLLHPRENDGIHGFFGDYQRIHYPSHYPPTRTLVVDDHENHLTHIAHAAHRHLLQQAHKTLDGASIHTHPHRHVRVQHVKHVVDEAPHKRLVERLLRHLHDRCEQHVQRAVLRLHYTSHLFAARTQQIEQQTHHHNLVALQRHSVHRRKNGRNRLFFGQQSNRLRRAIYP